MAYDAEILQGMARAFFASAWADQAEENGHSLRGEIMEQIPQEYDPAAWHAARTLWSDMTRENAGQTPLQLFQANAGGLEALTWGHYAAMQAMGHGVGLWEYDVSVQVPTIEFGAYGLQMDYWTLSLDKRIEEAKARGQEAGKAAASWVFDGNTTDETYRRVLQGIEDGDPEVYDMFRAPDLSGEWAGESETELLGDLLEEMDEEQADGRQDVCDAYVEAAQDAFWSTIETTCRNALSVEEEA